MSTTPRNPLASSGPQWLSIKLLDVWSAFVARHFCSDSVPKYETDAHAEEEGLSSICDRTLRDMVVQHRGDTARKFRVFQEIQRHNSESEQDGGFCLERQRERDSRLTVKAERLSENIRVPGRLWQKSQKEEICRAKQLKETIDIVDKIINFFMNFCQNKIGIIAWLAHETTSLNREMDQNWSDFNGRHSMNFREFDRLRHYHMGERLTAKIQKYYEKKVNCMTSTSKRSLTDAESVRSGQTHVTSQPAFFTRPDSKSWLECYAFLWELLDAATNRTVPSMSGTHMVYRRKRFCKSNVRSLL